MSAPASRPQELSPTCVTHRSVLSRPSSLPSLVPIYAPPVESDPGVSRTHALWYTGTVKEDKTGRNPDALDRLDGNSDPPGSQQKYFLTPHLRWNHWAWFALWVGTITALVGFPPFEALFWLLWVKETRHRRHEEDRHLDTLLRVAEKERRSRVEALYGR